MKISFLIAAHNEEKIIRKTLEHLSNFPYKKYEVIIGLDGCTDSTEEIVKEFSDRYSNFKYFKLNLRKGKPAVINAIIKKSVGDIIIINDADWIFSIKDVEKLKKMISFFNDEKIGGVAESFPVEWDKGKISRSNIGFKLAAYSSLFWLHFQRKNLTYKERETRYLKRPTMFLTNIFRKELYRENFSLGDDFERTKYIMDKGYKIVMPDDIEMPRMVVVYDKVNLGDLFRQKIRTSIARRQLKQEKILDDQMRDYYRKAIFFMLKESWSRGPKEGIYVSLWTFITAFASFISIFKSGGTKERWLLRIKR